MTGKMLKTYAVSVAVVGLIALSSLDAQAEVSYRTVALTADPAPGAGPGVVYSGTESPSTLAFGAPVLNGAGQTAFGGSLTGPGVDGTNNSGIWSEGSGLLSLVARTGDTAPGTELGVVYSAVASPVLNGAGQTAFEGSLTGPGVDSTNISGIWSEGTGSLSLVAREGGTAPGAGPGVVYSELFFNPILNGAGQTAFSGALTGPGVDSTSNTGVWSEGSGSLSLVAQAGDAAPGMEAGVVFAQTGSNLTFNGAGQTAFVSDLIGPDVDFSNNFSIWSEGSGSLNLVARQGDAAPGTGPGVVWDGFNGPTLNGAGQIAFQGFVQSTGVGSTGIWSEGSGLLSLVASEGDAAPGTGPGGVFSTFDVPIVINDAGQTMFLGRVSGSGVDPTNNTGIWSEGSGSLNLVAREGDAAPGTGPGEVFRDFNAITPVLNGAGQIAFLGFLTGTDVDEMNNGGIWATDPNGLLTLIAREGDLFDVNIDPLIDDLRTIKFVIMYTGFPGSGGEDGRATSFNDAGQLAFRLFFTDGSEGVFVATVPEPGMVAVLGLGVLALLRRHGR